MGASQGKCNECKMIFQVDKEKPEDNYSDVIKTMKCPACGSEDLYMLFGLTYDVGLGMVGNASNGYSKNIVYNPSKLGKFRGKKV